MTAKLHQITVTYLPAEDRLLLRIGTTEHTEYRLFLTRRFITGLWPLLGGQLTAAADLSGIRAAADADAAAQAAVDPDVKEAVLGMEHQELIQESNFQETHAEDNVDLTANSGPLVVTGAKVKPWDGKQLIIEFQTADKMNVTVTLDKRLLHGFCHMLATTVASAEWGLNLTIGDPAAQATPTKAIH